MKTKLHIVIIVTLSLVWLILSTDAAASDWFVRPAGGSYGSEDGTSYENAWDGLSNVVWGSGGVEAGDVLYICGTHINTYNTGELGTDYYFTPGATGTEADPITIKGYPDDPAIIWNAYIDERNNGIVPGNWTGPVDGVYYNETGVYAKIFTSYGLYENINGASYDKYTELDSAEEVTDYDGVGVYYKEAFGTNQHKIWLKPFEPSTFKENIRFSGYGGYYFHLGDGNNYIEYQDIDFIGGEILDTGPYHHYTFTNCTFLSYGALFIYTPSDANHITFDNCEFSHAGNGIYVFWFSGDIHHIYVKNSYFHDIGNPFIGETTDGHAIGIQNNEHFYFTGNTFERCGSAICFHVGATLEQKHCYVTGNFISDMRASYGRVTPGYGIIFQGSNDCPKGNTEDMLIAYNIVTNNEGSGISTTRKDFVNIYNNVVHSCSGNYTISGNRSDGASARFYNNISLFPKLNVNPYTGKIYGKNHIYFNQNYSDITYDFEADNNIYYPDAEEDGSFYFISGGDMVYGGVTFSQWKESHLSLGNNIDSNSYTVDPLLSNLSGSYSNVFDFNLQSSSPAIDVGKSVGLTQDFEGNPVPQGTAPDIGAYEYVFFPVSVIRNEPKEGHAPLTVSFDGSLSTSPHGDIVSYEWDFGDGSTSTGMKTSHIFTSAGEYTVTLTVTDDHGWKGESQTRITVFEKEFGELPAGCYNNVFNPAKGERALIVVELPKQAHVRLNLYNTRGNRIRELADEQKEAGTHKYYWNGKSGNGDVVGSGLYFVHIQAGDYRKTKKIVIIK